jgi:type VI secretion system protein ImpH
MATACRANDLAVVDSSGAARLRQEPFAFEFFQTVRLLARLFPGKRPVGRFVDPSTEVVRIATHPSLAFPASEIQSLAWRDDQPPLMVVNFMGLTGPLGVLPEWYTVQIIERLRAGDSTLRDFLDLFNHRSISLFYQAWEKYRFFVAYEHGERDRFSHHLLDLIGLGTSGLQDRQSVPDDALLFYAGLLAQRPRCAKALEQLLSDYFDVPVEVMQFMGGWYRLDPETQCCMQNSDTISEQLAVGVVVGDEIWDQHSRVRIRLGPLSLPQYLDFLPSGSAYEPLRALVRFFSNEEFDFEAQLILKRDEVPRCELGSEGGAAPQLGWVTWAKSAEMHSNPEDTILPL